MTMLLMPVAIVTIGKMAILARMATIAMVNANIRMGIRGIQLKSAKRLTQ